MTPKMTTPLLLWLVGCGEPVDDSLTVDQDGDGVAAPLDCDDGDANSTTLAQDADCDGVLSADDCDDGDAMRLAAEGDPNCDGVQAVQSLSPNDDRRRVDIDTVVEIVFDDPVDPDTVENIRVGVSGVMDGESYTIWEDTMRGARLLQEDGRTVRWTPSRGRLQEFNTVHWIEIDGVLNTNGQPMEPFRAQFTTDVVDEDYDYRFENAQFDGSLDTLPGEPIRAYLSEPFTRNFTGSYWTLTKNGDWWLMSNAWLGTERLLEGFDGTAPSYMAEEGEGVFTGRQWTFVAADDNDEATTNTSPNLYRLQTNWQGPDRGLAVGDAADSGELLLGMEGEPGPVYLDQLWIIHNVGRR